MLSLGNTAFLGVGLVVRNNEVLEIHLAQFSKISFTVGADLKTWDTELKGSGKRTEVPTS